MKKPIAWALAGLLVLGLPTAALANDGHEHAQPAEKQAKVEKAGKAKVEAKAKRRKKKEKAPMKEVWTCPMHPEVKADKPGACPKCNMDLVLDSMKKEEKK